MATNAQVFLGATLAFDGDTIGEIISASGTFMTRNKTAILTCDSTNGVAEQLQGSATPGDLTFTCIYDPTASGAYDSLTAAVAAQTSGVVTFTYPDATTLTATLGCLLDVGVPSAGGPDGEITVDLTIAVLDAAGWTYTDIPAV